MDTKIEVPSAWALLEHLLQKTEKQIMSISDINRENKKLSEEYQLKSQEEIIDFLSFFHGHGMLLFFKEEGLRTHAVLSIQWFSNAFSKLIADKEHINRDCKRRYIADWNHFNATGNLPNSLVEALWQEESSYIEHKTQLMSYMERLQMLVTIEGESCWYVPCMNQKPFTHDVFKQTLEKSSILCFRFTSFAIFVYYRLIAYCMSFLKWKVQLDKDKSQCLYHTAAIFETENHTVIVGIIDKDIQVQVLRINDPKLKVSCKIGKSIQTALTELTATFNEKKTFQKGYKCLNLFCSEKDQTFIPEDELSGSQCNCPIGRGKHKIDVQWTLGFWEDRNSCCFTIPVASRPNLDGRTRFAKLGMATNDVLNQAYRDIVELEILPTVCLTKVQSLPTILQLYPEQERLLQDAKHSGYKDFDISLSYKIIRNVCSKIPKPTKGRWGQNKMPAPGETTVGDDIERIRFIRNGLTGHVSSASTSQTEFDDTWSLMAGICQRLEVFTKKKYMDNLMYIQNLILKEKDEDEILEKLKKEHERETLETIKSDVHEIRTILKPETRDSADYDCYS
ncbi:uncharacterized protein LOC134272618 [Saccostrea cucullata]|uniref:uncharacterized protein LOC134272618 n=1 Tax=Saccostrea cuccullata TaxID=36930 RepID=UPI002ED3B70B